MVLDHQNHVISHEAYELYPDKRRPRGVDKATMDQMLKAGANASLVANEMAGLGHSVRVKDVHNRKRVLHAAGTEFVLMNFKILTLILQLLIKL